MDWGNRSIRKSLKEVTEVRVKLSEELSKGSLDNDRKRQVPEEIGGVSRGGMEKR